MRATSTIRVSIYPRVYLTHTQQYLSYFTYLLQKKLSTEYPNIASSCKMIQFKYAFILMYLSALCTLLIFPLRPYTFYL